ncbi:MAG: enoyl-CoA hydratase/isomerase family protein [Bacteroidales bacterium]|nr:enoyl-CoA hydratase/isomerase family protein [Bacteroidales bacterium]
MNHQEFNIWNKIGSIGVLAINNPPENYIEDPEFIGKEQVEQFLFDKDLKGILIKGTGRHFSAGADMNKLKQLVVDKELLAKKMSVGKDLIRVIEKLEIPVVAVVTGACFGAGLEIALASHIRICSENALFAFPETNYGIMPGLGGTVMLSKLIGPGKSAEIILSGSIVNAQKALEWKLVDYVVPGKDVLTFALSFLERLTFDRDIDVIHAVMRSIHNAQTLSFEEALEEETKLFCSLALKSMHDKP